MEKEKQQTLIVFVVILSLLVTVLGGYIIYKDWIMEGNKPVEINEDENKNLDVNSKTVQTLYNMVTYPGDMSHNYWEFYTESFTINTMENRTKLWMAYTQIQHKDIDFQYNVDKGLLYEEIKSNIVDQAMKDVFGENSTYTKDTFIPIGCYKSFEYHSDSDSYISTTKECEVPLYPYVASKLSKAIQTKNTIELYEKFVYVNYEKDWNQDTEYEKGIYKKLDPTTLIEKIDDTKEFEDTFQIDNYLNQATTVKYIFTKLEDGNYYFSNSEIID